MFPTRCLFGVVLGLALLLLSACQGSGPDKRLLLTFRGNAGRPTCVVFSPDGTRIASCHWERAGTKVRPEQHHPLREVMIWDAQTGKKQVTMNKGPATWAIAYYPDGN